jgi:hypothetical protein
MNDDLLIMAMYMTELQKLTPEEILEIAIYIKNFKGNYNDDQRKRFQCYFWLSQLDNVGESIDMILTEMVSQINFIEPHQCRDIKFVNTF